MIIFTVAFIIALLLMPLYNKLLAVIGSFNYNFENKIIPFSYGGFILFAESIMLLIYPVRDINHLWISLLVMTVVGTYDDLFGEKTIKGLRGHFAAFIDGKITSGFIKAIAGFIIAIYLGFKIGNQAVASITHFLLILFMINLMNLFDLRPGRALKVFFILFSFLGLTTIFLYENSLGLIIMGILVVVFFQDLRAKIMLGDSGANLLGLHLGIWYSQYIPLIWQWFFILVLIVLHIYAEKYSLTTLINNHRMLRKIDLWGRKT